MGRLISPRSRAPHYMCICNHIGTSIHRPLASRNIPGRQEMMVPENSDPITDTDPETPYTITGLSTARAPNRGKRQIPTPALPRMISYQDSHLPTAPGSLIPRTESVRRSCGGAGAARIAANAIWLWALQRRWVQSSLGFWDSWRISGARLGWSLRCFDNAFLG